MRRLVALAMLLLASAIASAAETLTHGRFAHVRLYVPDDDVQRFVMLLSDADGWTPAMVELAKRISAEGGLVAGIDTPAFIAALDDGGECVNAVGDFENLAHFVQGYRHVQGYHRPLFAGVGSGAALAYATVAQAPPEIFAGQVSLDFCPTLALHERLCARDDGAAIVQRHASGQTLLPQALQPPWRRFASGGLRCPESVIKAFDRTSNMTPLQPTGDWRGQFVAALRTLAPAPATVAALPASLDDLPLVEVPSRAPGTHFAVLLSGDGGWAGLDKEVATTLAAHGLPVVGFDSLRYFWSARTPRGLAADLARLVVAYAARWHRDEVVLIGYSQGADVLPFAVNRLPDSTRQRVTQVVLIAPGERASFEFHLDNWLRRDDDGLPTLPELVRLDPGKALCLYGTEDADAICPRLKSHGALAESLPGDHHFDGDYATLAARILERAGPRGDAEVTPTATPAR